MRYSASAHTRFTTGSKSCGLQNTGIKFCSAKCMKGVFARDHIHTFLSISPKLSLPDVTQRIEGRSSHSIQIEFPELRKR